MKIKSDKQNKNNTSLKNNLKLKLIKMLTYLILSVLISSFYYYISENFWAIYCGIIYEKKNCEKFNILPIAEARGFTLVVW